jgi:type II secretory pathway pseudopilin PulG
VRAGREGYSIIQLMMVLSLVSVLAVLALPDLTRRFSHDRLNRSAHQLASDLRWARQLAITSHLRTHLRFISAETYLIEKEDPVSGWSAAAPPVELSPGIHLQRGGTPQFDPKGVVVPTASFVLEGRGESRTVIVSMTGRVRIG